MGDSKALGPLLLLTIANTVKLCIRIYSDKIMLRCLY